MEVIFSSKADADLKFWNKTNAMIAKRVGLLLGNIKETPHRGIGKPEALKHELSGLWSRRIDREHRLVYSYDLKTNSILVRSCKGHYC